MRDLRGSDDGEVKRRDHRHRDSDHAESGLQVAGRAKHGANREQNCDNNPESDLAAYPQFVSKRILHRLNQSPF
jgi:hypothetical protein